ncbi:MAG TPA: hypothetical protein VHR42_00230 [Clostridia bacterium]|nr:hypothetical protein [Clostridia bacterium]
MNTVLLYGSEKNARTGIALFAAIRAVGCSALHVTPKSISMIPPGNRAPDFLILEFTEIPELIVGNGLVLFEQESGLSLFQKQPEIPVGFTAVVDPDNADAIEMLQRNSMQTVTCGMSQKDTVTFSSLDSDRAVVSLQRELRSLSGTTIEPREFPVGFSKQPGEYQLLASAAVLLLSDIPIPDDGFMLS